MDEHSNGLMIPLGDGSIELTEGEAKALHALHASEYWPVLERLMRGIQEGSTVALRNPEATLDQMRVAQGRIQGVQLVAQTVTEEVRRWWEHQVESRRTTGENP